MKSMFSSRIACRAVRFLVALALAGLTGGVEAQLYLGTLFTGLYSVVGEEGSGLTATHEEPVIFLTFYIYRADRSAYWLTATVVRGPDVNGSHHYTGDLYETSGPPVGGPFDPKTVTYRKVGTVSLLSRDGYTVTLTYTIDGVPISKNYTRFTLNNLNYGGTYYSTMVYDRGTCSSPSLFAVSGPTTVTQSSNALAIVLQGAGTTCTLSGDYQQSGSLGGSSGNFSCTDSTPSGPMALVNLQMTQVGFTAQFAVNAQQCNHVGVLTGILLSRP